jgi:glycosyltransferase involved in cell wall biosynthesis
MDEPIRVLQIITQMNRAGMENRIMDLYRTIDRKKVQFDFYTCRQDVGIYDSEISDLGGMIYYSEPLSIAQILSIPKRFENFMKEHQQYKIVHCHLNQWCGLILKGVQKAGVPVRIAHSRTALEKNGFKNIIKNLIKRFVNRTATHKFAVSIKAGIWLFGKRTFEQGEVVVWPNAIDCEKFRFNDTIRSKVRNNLQLDDRLVLIHVGNLRPEKNHLFLLKIFAEVKKKKSNAILMLIGVDNMNGKVQDIAKKLGIYDDVMFLGSRSDVQELLQAGDIFVFPSLYEGFPGALLEAETAGLPCLISDTITDEVMLTSCIKKLSIDLEPNYWADQILSISAINRNDVADIIIEHGYDIVNSSIKILDFYLNISSKNEEGK